MLRSGFVVASAPAPISCTELRRLMDEYQWAVSEHFRYQSAQLVAIVNSDPFSFQRELHDAETRKNEAKYAILAHQEAHGCG